MSQNKKKLKLTEVLLIVEVVVLAAVAALVLIIAGTKGGSISAIIGQTVQFGLYSVTFGLAGAAASRTASLLVGAFFWINFVIALFVFIAFLKKKAKRQLWGVLTYFLAFVFMTALASGLMIIKSEMNKLQHMFPLVAAISVVVALFYVISILCLIASAIEALVPSIAAQPVAEEKPAEEAKEEPAEEEKPAEEPAPEEKKEEPVAEEKPAEEAAPAEEEEEEEAPADAEEEVPAEDAPAFPTSKRKPKTSFVRKLTKAEDDLKEKYNDLKAHILSYPVNSRLSVNGDTFRAHRDTYVVITIAGKKMKVYVAVNPADYANTPIPVQDVSAVKKYAETPTLISVRSDLSLRRAKKLIDDAMAKKGMAQGEVVEKKYDSQAIRTYRRTK